MKILVFPHAMELGGSQLNAIEIAAAVRDRGHEVGIISEDGPLVDRVHALGLPHHQLVSKTGIRPSWRVVRQLRSLVEAEGYEVVHGYEWPPAIEAALGSGRLGTPVTCTVMSMSVAPFLPHSMPLVVGTRQIERDTASAGFRDVTVIEPPVDMRHNAPGTVQPLDVSQYGVCADALVMASVSRLAPELKLEGLLAACDATAILNLSGSHVHLLVVGDGPARLDVYAAAQAANAATGHDVVHLIGALDDPRPAYEAGDILIGMGGSAIRSLAFAKPLIVQGERGFWRTATPESVEVFLDQGWYGLGPEGGGQGVARLVAQLRELTAPQRRAELGSWGRTLALRNFSLAEAALRQEALYRRVSSGGFTMSPSEAVWSAARASWVAQARRVTSLVRPAARDDFNAVAAKSGA